MRRFVEQADRGQRTILPECLDDFISENNPVRVIDVFVDTLDLAEMSFDGVDPAMTGRPSYHPSVPKTASTTHSLLFVQLCEHAGDLARHNGFAIKISLNLDAAFEI